MKILKNTEYDRLSTIAVFLKELSSRLGRSEIDIFNRGLFDADFSGQIRLLYEDGSYVHYENAFLIKNSTHVGVFTERLGYFLFKLNEFHDYVQLNQQTSNISK